MTIKTFPIRLTVEDVALGAVLRKLHHMPGVTDIGLDLGPAAALPELQKAATKKSTLIERTKSGRAVKGEGFAALKIILNAAAGPMRGPALRERLTELGYTARGASALLFRCKRDKLIRASKDGWDLTAKGKATDEAEIHG